MLKALKLEHAVSSCMLRDNTISGLHSSELSLENVARNQDTGLYPCCRWGRRAGNGVPWGAGGLKISHLISQEQTEVTITQARS